MFDKNKIKKAVELIIEAIGEDKEREGLRDTPERIADMYEEIFSGIGKDAAGIVAEMKALDARF
ncbi:MAG TPA: GTP cyclohydrolase I, partial [Caldisericia bacterium]|nr:GTP cyclohydrolase I [Caldisericia bacterium]